MAQMDGAVHVADDEGDREGCTLSAEVRR